MRILVSNDDGIDSRGIFELAQGLKEIGEVTVVAPLSEQSAAGHSITMKDPLRVIRFYKNGDFFGYAVEGTPADCVKMGIRNIMPEPPDIVVSGINHGSNTASNIIYSGTVSAAREATLMDVPAIAMSQTSHFAKDFTFAAKVAKALVTKTIEKGIPSGTLLNVNVPDVPEHEIKGIKITRQGLAKWSDKYESRVDPMGKEYFWLTGELIDDDVNEDNDQLAITKKYVSVTPVKIDWTDHETREAMNSWDIESLIS